jgi:flagellar basal body rod protein FlgC
LGEALWQQGRTEAAIEAIRTSLEIEPNSAEARTLARVFKDPSPAAPHAPVRPWPAASKQFQDPRKVLTRYMLRGRNDPRFITAQTAFAALGSCFAGELATRLSAAGRDVHHELIGEEVNSTFANRRLLEWLEQGSETTHAEIMEQAFGIDVRERLRSALSRSDVVIMTLGVAPGFFHHVTGEFGWISGRIEPSVRDHLMTRHVMRNTTVAENVANLRAILASMQRLAGRRQTVVLTVSPVPLQGATHAPSAVEADCLSKSVLRLACDEIVRDPGDATVVYWPSFEMVRWLGSYYVREPAFGAEDRTTVHVSRWLIDIVVGLFLEHFSVDDAAEAPTPAGRR